MTRDGCGIVDGISIAVLGSKETRLKFRDLIGEGAIIQCRLRMTSVIEAYEIMPMPGIAVALLALAAIYMNGRGLFPKRPLRKHHSRRCRRECQITEVLGRITCNLPLFAWFAG